MADRDRGAPWNVETRTQVGSVSKQIVAVVALLLAEKGAADLDRELGSAWPQAPGHWSGVTLRQLLQHTAGVPHWHDEPGFVPRVSMTFEDRLGRVLAHAPQSSPGTTWAYSSPGYLLAAALIERMAGGSYFRLADELVVTPLGLELTRIGDALEADAASGYRGDDAAPRWDLARVPGTGDVTSTAADLAVLVERLHSGDLVDVGPGSAYSTTMPITTADRDGTGVRLTGYGLGHYVGTISGRPAVLCPGDNPGYRSLAAWLPDTRTCLVLVGNDESQDIDAAAAALLGAEG